MIAPDYHTMMAIEVYGHDPRCRWFDLQVLGDYDPDRPRSETFFRMTTGVCLQHFARGPRKGLPNWAARIKELDREEIVPFAKLDEFVAKKKAEASK